MPSRSLLHVVQLTPPGRGAVATLLIEGPGADDVVQSRFRSRSGRALEACRGDRLVFGRFLLDCGPGREGQAEEEVVVRRRGPESIEIHCHGGFVAVSMIQQAIMEQGCHAVSWNDWVTKHHVDPITAAACLALAEARTERTANILLDQHQGALRRAIDAAREALEAGEASSAARQIEAMLAHARTGLHLVEPWRVVLAGRPNVGKSSLINALLGYRRAIVHPAPGTTRDVLTAVTAIDGWPVELADTAGLREPAGCVEQAGVQLAQRQLAAADVVVLVFDGTEPWSAENQQLADDWPEALRVHNKADLLAAATPPRPEGLWTSALTGQGIDTLLDAIAQRLVPHPPAPGAAVPFAREQIERLRTARAALGRGEIDKAREAIAW